MDRAQVLKMLAKEVLDGKPCFSSNVHVALKIRQALDDPDCHADEAVRLVQAEPMLAARVVAMANSIAFNPGGNEITDVRKAVSRLGFRTVRNLATALVTRQMAQMPVTPAERSLAAGLWEYTANVASLARVLARQVTRQDPETAVFAAIVHDVGGFYLLARAADFPGVLATGLDDDDIEGEILLARAVLQELSVPESVVSGIEDFWKGYLGLPPQSLGDTLLLAAQLSPVQRPLNPLAGRNRGEMAADLNLLVGETDLQAILAEAADEVRSLLAVLHF